jgi:hypothetical protein
LLATPFLLENLMPCLKLRVSLLVLTSSLGLSLSHNFARAQPASEKSVTAVSQSQIIVEPSLAALNDDFKKLYRAQTNSVMQDSPLILLVGSDAVTTLLGKTRVVYPVSGPYDEMKSALHSVLGFQGLMTRLAAEPSLNDGVALTDFSKKLGELLTLVPQTAASADLKRQAIEVITQLKEATDQSIMRKTVNQNEVKAVLAKVRPTILSIAQQVGRLSGESLKIALLGIQSEVKPEDWARAIAVIPGPITARLNNLNVAVTASVMGRNLIGERIFYSENIYDEQGMIAFVEMLMRDKKLSTVLFDNPYRMWRDLLADASADYVDQDFVTALAK